MPSGAKKKHRCVPQHPQEYHFRQHHNAELKQRQRHAALQEKRPKQIQGVMDSLTILLVLYQIPNWFKEKS
jgi:hypothetical protein